MAGNSVSFFQPGSEQAIDLRQLQRQRDMADMLTRQGQTSPQGQMVNGHFVAPGKTAYVAQLANALFGGMASRRADEQEREMGARMQSTRAKEATDFMAALQGSPGREIPPLTPNDDEGNPMPAAQAAATPPDRNRALALALQSQNPQMQAMGGDLMKRQLDAAEFQQALQAAGGGAPAAGGATAEGAPAAPAGGNTFGLNPAAFAMSASPNSRAQALGKMIQENSKPLNVTEGGTLFNPGTNSPMFTAPKTEPGIAVSNGVASPIPGFAEAQANRERLQANARQSAESANTMVTINTPEGPRMVTRQQALGMAGGGGGGQPTPGLANPTEQKMAVNAAITDNPAASAQREIAALKNDLGKVPDAGSKKMIQDEINRLEGQMQKYPAPTAAKPSGPGIALQTDADRVRETKTAEADVARDTGQKADVKTANKFLNIASRVKDVFEDGPTDSLVGSVADSAMAAVGKSSKGAEAAQRLKALGGWMVANVPRMEGPQSNFDVANYQVMAADVANDKLPLARRKAALESIEGMMRDVVSGKASAPAGTTPPAASRSLKDFGYASPADALKDAQRAMQANPNARAEILKRLKDMGVEMPAGAQGGW